MSSIIYNLNGNDKTLILDTRNSLLQSFKAVNWTDLRLTMALSVTKQSDPNDPTGLLESIGAGESKNHFYIGFKSSDGDLPPATNFYGISSKVISSPSSGAGIADTGSFNTAYSLFDTQPRLLISNGVTLQNQSTVIGTFPFQDRVSGGAYTGYATLIILRMLRNDPTWSLVTSLMAVFDLSTQGICNPLPFLSDTSIANLRAITASATFTQFGGPFTFASVPDAIYLFWPFNNSRLRIHSMVLEKYG